MLRPQCTLTPHALAKELVRIGQQEAESFVRELVLELDVRDEIFTEKFCAWAASELASCMEIRADAARGNSDISAPSEISPLVGSPTMRVQPPRS